MADVDTGGGGGRGRKGSGPKTKKKSTRIDMTAMVDVAFLLLTFFVLTATMSNSAVMELTMPPKVEEEQKDDLYKDILEDKIMTIVLEADDKISYYVGITNPEVLEANFGDEGEESIRNVIQKHLDGDGSQPRCETGTGARIVKNCWDPIFVVKPRKVAKYRNLVDLLDEFAITDAPKYAIDEFTEKDSLLLIGELQAEEEEEEG